MAGFYHREQQHRYSRVSGHHSLAALWVFLTSKGDQRSQKTLSARSVSEYPALATPDSHCSSSTRARLLQERISRINCYCHAGNISKIFQSRSAASMIYSHTFHLWREQNKRSWSSSPVMLLERFGPSQKAQRSVHRADLSTLAKVRSQSKKVLWITSEINVLKLEYNLVISRDDNTFKDGLLQAFICNCLRLYRLSLKYDLNLPVSDRLPGDDAALLAAMGLIRLYKTRQKYPEHNNALLRSVVVLEHLLLRSKHNYDALLILVRLYIFLGAGSLAVERYSRLSIKNLQHATVSWVLYTRISTIHPHPVTISRTNDGGQTTMDLASDMSQALDWHKGASGLSKTSVTSMQENGQWSMSLDALSTSAHIESGFSKLLLFVETKRVARFLSVTHEIQSLDISK